MTIVRNWIVPQVEPRTGTTNPPLITTTSLPNATQGNSYSFAMSATGGVPPYTWSLSSVSPDTGNWLSIDPVSGTLSGLPGTAETEAVRVKVTDSVNAPTAPTAFSLLVQAGSPIGAPATIWPGNIGLQSFAFTWDPPVGVTPNSYQVNRFQNGILQQTYTGITNDPSASNRGWIEDRGLLNGTTYTWTVQAVVNGVAGAQSGPVTATTLALGASATPAPVAPLSWIAPFQLPTGTVWTCTNTATADVAGTDNPPGNGLGNSGCSFQHAINGYSPGDLIVLTAGATYQTDTTGQGFIFANKANPNNLWTYVISSETPGYTGGTQTLPAQQFLPLLGAGVTDYTGTGGNFVTPANAAAMPVVQIQAVNGIGLNLAQGTNFLRFVGLHVRPPLGGTGPLPFTAALSAGATGGTLATPWGGTTRGYSVIFSDNECRNVSLTTGSTGVIWSPGLVNAVTANAVFENTSWSASVCVQMPNLPANGSIPTGTPCESIYFDRCRFGTDPATLYAASNGCTPLSNGIYIFGNHILVQQCHLDGFSDNLNAQGAAPFEGVPTRESHGFLMEGGSNVCVRNNYISSLTEGFFGGGGWVPLAHPITDVTIAYNFNYKNPGWFNNNHAWDMKNHVEFKAGTRIHVHHNVHSNNANGIVDPQNGRSMQYWAADNTELNPWCATSDVDVHDNLVANVACPVYFSGSPGPVPAVPLNPWGVNARMRYYNNIVYMNTVTTNANSTSFPYCFQIAANVPDTIYDHNTTLMNRATNTLWASQGQFAAGFFSAQTQSANNWYLAGDGHSPNGRQNYADRCTFTNNITDGRYGFSANGLTGAAPNVIMPTVFPNGTAGAPNASSTVANNLYINDIRSFTGNDFTASGNYANVGFKSFAGISAAIPTPPQMLDGQWNVTATHNTSSTTGTPLGAIFGEINNTWWAPNSVWNTPIPPGTFANALPNSATVLAAYQSAGGSITSAFNPQSSTFTAALIVAPSGTATTTWSFTYNVSGQWTFTKIPATGAVATQIQNAASFFQTNGDTDRSINLYSTDTGQMYDIYPDAATTGGNGPIAIVTASVRPIGGAGWWNQANFTTLSSGTASGADQVGGSIKPSEWATGVIPHALMGAYPVNLSGANSSSSDWGEAFIYPARGGDGGNFNDVTGKLLPEGARLQLDPSLSDAQLTALGVPTAMLPVCHAMQTYGWYCMDIDGTFPAQIKFLSTNPNGSAGFNGPYAGAASLPMALMAHVAWIPGPYLVGSSGLGTGVAVTGTAGQCSYTTNYGSADGLVHVGDVMTVYPAFQFGSTPGTGGLQGFNPVLASGNNMNNRAWWAGVSYVVSAVGAGTFTLISLQQQAITSTIGTMNVYFTTTTALDSPDSALASGFIRQGP